MPVRFAYVGCGFVAQTIHIPNFAALGECEFAAIAEVRPELGQSVAKRFGIPKVYKSHEQIAADPSIQAVGVSAPYALQGRIAEDLARAGKHVFMEKPMAVNLRRAEQIVAAEKAGGGRVMVGYMKRYDPGNLLLKKHLDAWRASGDVGRILLARCHGFGGNWVYARDANVPFQNSPVAAPTAPEDCPEWLPAERRDSYLGYLQQWTHNVNLLRFFLADGKTPSVKVKSVQLDPKDGMTGIVVLEINGVRSVVESAYTRFHSWEEHTQIYFEGGYLRTQAPALMHKETPATCEMYRAGTDQSPPTQTREFADPAWSYREEARAFLKNVQSGEPFASSALDTLEDVRLFEEIYREFIKTQV
jgi:predicted dehydrogenase